jgi:hypothetical protein
MGQSRLDLQTLLETCTPKVYFQPPASVQMEYPCIVYARDTGSTQFADDRPYRYDKRYSVTIIARDPDSDIPDKVAMLPKSVFNRHYTADQLHHDVFNVYF